MLYRFSAQVYYIKFWFQLPNKKKPIQYIQKFLYCIIIIFMYILNIYLHINRHRDNIKLQCSLVSKFAKFIKRESQAPILCFLDAGYYYIHNTYIGFVFYVYVRQFDYLTLYIMSRVEWAHSPIMALYKKDTFKKKYIFSVL